MGKYRVRHYECYEKYYEIEAKNAEAAEEELINRIATGEENPPEECFASGAVAEPM